MTDVLKKYRDRVKYLEELLTTYQQLIATSASQMTVFVKGDESLEQSIERVTKRVVGANNIFQITQIEREYTDLLKRVVLKANIKQLPPPAPPPPPKKGRFLSWLSSTLIGVGEQPAPKPAEPTTIVVVQPAPAPQHPGEEGKQEPRPPAPVDMDEAVRRALLPYIILLNAFAKGAIILSTEKDPFHLPLRQLRENKYENLLQQEAAAMAYSLNSFFFGKSNEALVVSRERMELKKIITALTNYILELGRSSEKFNAHLESYSQNVNKALTLDDLKKIQRAIIMGTQEMQKENTMMRERFTEYNRKMRMAAERIAKLEKALEMATQEKYVDSLTGIHNRGYFDEKLVEAVTGFQRYKEPLCLMMLDIDHFKKFNDTYGHPAGDQVIRVVAEIIRESVRAVDTVARYGGEEFAVIVYKAELEGAIKLADQIREAVRTHEFVIKSDTEITIHVSISIGIAQIDERDTGETLVVRADKALYVAKDQGRDKVVAAE